MAEEVSRVAVAGLRGTAAKHDDNQFLPVADRACGQTAARCKGRARFDSVVALDCKQPVGVSPSHGPRISSVVGDQGSPFSRANKLAEARKGKGMTDQSSGVAWR